MFAKNRGFVFCVFVEADFADAQHAGAVDEFGDHGDHFPRQRDVLGFLGVDAQPGVMLNPRPAGPRRFEFGQLAKVIAKTVDAAAVESRPERRFADGDAAHPRHPLVVIRHTGNHVHVGVDVIHVSLLS